MRLTMVFFWFLNFMVLIAALVLAGAPQAVIRERAYQAALRGDMETARARYDFLAAFGDPISRNNVLVIDYRRTRFESGKPLYRSERRKLSRDAQSEFFILAQEGLPAAMYNYAMFYYRLPDTSPDYEHVKAMFRKAGQKGDALSELAYALQLSHMKAHPDNAERMRRLKALADKGVAAAATEYADAIRGLDGVSDDEVEAYVEVAAKAGDLEAQRWMGHGFDRDDEVEWLEKAAAQGSFAAMTSLGNLYQHGSETVEPDLRRAFAWYELAIGHAVRPAPVPDMVVARGGFRWRDVVFYRPSNHNVQESAAREAANLLIAGRGGVKRNLKYAEDLLNFADRRWNGASVLRAQLEYAEAPAAQREAVLCGETASALRTERKEDRRALAALADACHIRMFTWIDFLEAEARGALAGLSQDDVDRLRYEAKESSHAYLVLRPFTLDAAIRDLRGALFVIPDGAAVPAGIGEARADVCRLSSGYEQASDVP